ncbi:proline--tRNA ligase [Streptomyces tanashiensis]|uniref:proline--tRNA ligase n=1 Tax=Streptomyces tanashiensis TaxID=67367 RepID=UPI0033F6CBC6
MADLIRVSTLWPPVRPRSIDLDATTHGLLEAVGVIREADLAGSFALMPLGVLIRDRIEAIIRRSFVEHGFGAIMLPVLQSRAIWESSGRWQTYADQEALFRVVGRGEEATACLGPTSEEISVVTVASDLVSHRDLPVRLYQSTSKFRNELSPRGGLLRAREFEMADAYTFDADRAGMLAAVEALNAACQSALSRMGLPGVQRIPADGGDISKAPSTEHVVRSELGQSQFVECPACAYRADPEVAVAAFPHPDRHPAADAGAQTVKVMAFGCVRAGEELVVSVVIRGDLQVSLRKVVEILEASSVRALSEAEFRASFSVEPHTLNPAIALSASDEVLFDTSVADLRDFTTVSSATGLIHGANWGEGPLLDQVIPEHPVAVHAADAGLWCGRCGEARFEVHRAIELGHVFELGDRYSTPMGLRFVDREGRDSAPLMACSGIGVGRCLQTLADAFRDERGLNWPAEVAPAQVHMIVAARGEEPERDAMRLQGVLAANGISTLLDDRDVSLGERFRYAWALGLPHHVVVSSRTREGVYEHTDRTTGLSQDVAESELLKILKGDS